jgi:hypothetical protein
MLYEHFRDTLRKICDLIEDMAIENQIYTEVILENVNISLSALQARVAEARLDPERRKQAQETYAALRQALEQTGIAALGEGLLEDLPPTDKPN